MTSLRQPDSAPPLPEYESIEYCRMSRTALNLYQDGVRTTVHERERRRFQGRADEAQTTGENRVRMVA